MAAKKSRSQFDFLDFFLQGSLSFLKGMNFILGAIGQFFAGLFTLKVTVREVPGEAKQRTLIEVRPNGTRVEMDGKRTRIETAPDGRVTKYTADGRTIEYDATGDTKFTRHAQAGDTTYDEKGSGGKEVIAPGGEAKVTRQGWQKVEDSANPWLQFRRAVGRGIEYLARRIEERRPHTSFSTEGKAVGRPAHPVIPLDSPAAREAHLSDKGTATPSHPAADAHHSGFSLGMVENPPPPPSKPEDSPRLQ